MNYFSSFYPIFLRNPYPELALILFRNFAANLTINKIFSL